MKLKSHTVSIFVANKPGVLVRVAQVFSKRGYNIDSLVVSPGKDSSFSRMTVTAVGNPGTLSQIIMQLKKLVDVQHATEHQGQKVIEKELALVKVNTTNETRRDIHS